MRMFLNSIRWGLMDEKLKGEDALRASGAPYTIVRPGGLTNQLAGKAKLTWSALLTLPIAYKSNFLNRRLCVRCTDRQSGSVMRLPVMT